MSEGHIGGHGGDDKPPQAGGLEAQAVPTTKKLFLLEYVDELRKGIRWLRATPKPDEGVRTKVTKGFRKWSKGRKARIGVAAVLAIMMASYALFSGQAATTETIEPEEVIAPGPSGNKETLLIGGTVTEQGVSTSYANLSTTRFSALWAQLSWTDESVAAFQRNQPDQLGLNVTAPNGKSWLKPFETDRSITWNLSAAELAVDYAGPPPDAAKWTFTVMGGNMGDITPISGRPCAISGFICQPDTGNSYSMSVEYAW